MRWKFEREDLEIYKCCFCCHVRTGTLLLGILDLLANIAGVGLLIVAVIHPELVERFIPQSVPEKPLPSNETSLTLKEPKVLPESIQALAYTKNWNVESFVAAILLMAASMMITVCLIYGTIRGVSKYITPYFCVRMFDLCLSGLTMLSWFSDLPAVRRWITAQDNLPFKQQLLDLDNDHLTLLTLIIFVCTLSVKAYFIGVVWACYKYLKAHETTQCRVRVYDSEEVLNHEDTEMLLPPKYEDVLLMPEDQANPPPPAYTPQ